MSNAITREEAIETIYALVDSGILQEDIEGRLMDIANAIENEKFGLHMWGADNGEYDVLTTAVRADLMTEEYKANGQRIWDKYSFVPSPFEEEEINENLQLDEAVDEEVDEEE